MTSNISDSDTSDLLKSTNQSKSNNENLFKQNIKLERSDPLPDIHSESDDNIDSKSIKPIKKVSLIKYKNKVICDYCGNDFLSTNTLEKHFGYHAENGFKLIQCKFCLLLFCTEAALEEHEQTHYTELLSCDICNKRFVGIINLKCHVARYHSLHSVFKVTEKKPEPRGRMKGATKARKLEGNKPNGVFLCNVCGISTISPSALAIHMRRHTGEKPFKCPECVKSFSISATLKIHMRKHTGERPYLCEQCPKSFNQRANLKQHINFHHIGSEGKFNCAICNKGFLQKCFLAVHMKKHN